MGTTIMGSGFRVRDLGFEGLGLRVRDLGFSPEPLEGSGVRIRYKINYIEVKQAWAV